MNKSLTRSIGFWLLPVLSLITTGVGWWFISGQIASMTDALLNGTATGVEVYVGQSLVVVGAALLGTGILGILLTFALTAAQGLVHSMRPVLVEPIDWAAVSENGSDAEIADAGIPDAEEKAGEAETEDAGPDQKGSSGSIATATKISVR
ncbi:hypothetical protein [Microbacterium sp. SD291]|uniref:hypothetical protein n=1 Tax=Microbacterium sp. SD291 TaxID=2782007 RepID=UPI001A95AC50|nr:hypothetical protein [Microbacterium sp. SD291]MBO0979216.1 hypothetical protein [Microbacterium sp. SD291]